MEMSIVVEQTRGVYKTTLLNGSLWPAAASSRFGGKERTPGECNLQPGLAAMPVASGAVVAQQGYEVTRERNVCVRKSRPIPMTGEGNQIVVKCVFWTITARSRFCYCKLRTKTSSKYRGVEGGGCCKLISGYWRGRFKFCPLAGPFFTPFPPLSLSYTSHWEPCRRGKYWFWSRLGTNLNHPDPI